MGFVKGINHGVRFSSIICVVVVHVLVSVQLFLVVIIHLVLDLCPAWYVSFWFVLRVCCIVVGMLVRFCGIYCLVPVVLARGGRKWGF